MRIFLTFLSLFLVASCEAQSELPKQMPEQLVISFDSNGGMLRAYTRITIEDHELKYEELKGGQQEPEKWSAKLSDDDLSKLYKAFVDNRFDTIKNDRRTDIVYDAGSESISISAGVGRSFHISYGMNSPLSGKNLTRYQAVNRAIAVLASECRSRKV